MFLQGHSLFQKGVKSIFVIGLLFLSINHLSYAHKSAFALSVNCSQMQPATNESSTDGIGTFTINGGVTPFTYQLFDAANNLVNNGSIPITNTTVTLNDLRGGAYRIEVMGQNETQSCTFIIGLTNCGLGVAVADVTVNCASDLGNLSAATTNGILPLTYLWSTGATTPTISNVPPGTHSVTIMDNAGCTANDMATITAMSPTNVVVSITSTMSATDFETDDGNVNFSINGGVAPYDIVITNTQTNVPILSLNNINAPTTINTFPGNYSILATDNAGCTGTNSFQIGVATCLFEMAVTDISTACDISQNILTAVPNNRGILPFTYLWSTGSTSDTTSNLLPGSYTVTATDAVGCQSIKTGMVLGNPPLTLTCNVTQNNTLIGGVAGEVSIDIRNGNPAYTATLYRNNQLETTFPIASAGISNLNNLATGQYRLNIVDQNNCPIVCAFEITEPVCGIMIQLADLTLPCVDATGDLQATISGGVPPYIINWSNSITTALNTNLPSGTYTITVKDQVNCEMTSSATIFTRDRDEDGYFAGCVTFPAGALLEDCDDNDKTVFPGAPEICDYKDNDCNGEIDEVLVDGQVCPSRVVIPVINDWGLFIFGLLVLNLGVLGVLYRERLEKE